MDLSSVPAIDGHAHNVVRPEVASGRPYVQAFTEASDPAAISSARETLFFRRSLRDLAALLGCDATEQAIIARRKAMGFEPLVRRCFEAARLSCVLLDDGYLPADVLPLSWHARFLPVKRLLRIENVAEELLLDCTEFEVFESRFREKIANPGADVVGYKSIACYRSGLAIETVSREQARKHFQLVKEQQADRPARLTDKPLIDYCLGITFEIAIRRGLAVQLHTGLGDPDLDLRLANPLHLRGVLENPVHRGLKLVLLHASYPYMREAGYLANVYPHVYVDFGLAIPFSSVAGMRCVLRELLELAPLSRLMYSSDAHVLPELFFLGAKWARRVLGEVLESAVSDGDLTAAEADEAARRLLAENARALYQLEARS